MIEASGLTKNYGAKTAVDRLSFAVRPGVVTGFLGPNGSGKSTTMRLMLGLDRPDHGRAVINGREYRSLPAPLTEVGAMLEARAVHTGRSARNHLLALAATHRIPRRRVDEVIGMVGLDSVARKRAGGFSLGMGQRLGIGSALLGDPGVLLLDEPVNGLDPEGIRWIRNLLKDLAAEGRTVFVSSHLMSEMALTASEVVVIGRGRLIAAGTVSEVVGAAGATRVLVRAQEPARLGAALTVAGYRLEPADGDAVHVCGTDSATIGRIAAREGIGLIELTPQLATLEEAFMKMTRDSAEFTADATVRGRGTHAVSGARR